jgi:hypothetical protein
MLTPIANPVVEMQLIIEVVFKDGSQKTVHSPVYHNNIGWGQHLLEAVIKNIARAMAEKALSEQ